MSTSYACLNDVKAGQQNKLSQLFWEDKSSPVYYEKYWEYLCRVMASFDYHELANVSECFLSARERGSTIFFVGNGGSAATASHFSQDLAEVGRKAKVRGFKSLSLTDNVSYLTAVGNDYGYDEVFTIQLAELFKGEDVLVAISASGNSPNVIRAAKHARENGGLTVGFIGFDGGRLSELCDYKIHVKTNNGEYGPVEDVHLILNHMITSFLTFQLRERKRK